MKKVRQLIWIGLVLGGLWTTVACQKKEKEKPEMATESDVEEASENTEEFFEALEEHDFEKAKEYVTPETRPILEKVMADVRRQEEQDNEKPAISVVILERKPLIGKVQLQVKITVGPHVRKETLVLVPVNDTWQLVMAPKKIALLRLVVIYQPYEVVIVKEKKHKHHHHHPHGHAYGHHKHGHEDDDE